MKMKLSKEARDVINANRRDVYHGIRFAKMSIQISENEIKRITKEQGVIVVEGE